MTKIFFSETNLTTRGPLYTCLVYLVAIDMFTCRIKFKGLKLLNGTYLGGLYSGWLIFGLNFVLVSRGAYNRGGLIFEILLYAFLKINVEEICGKKICEIEFFF